MTTEVPKASPRAATVSHLPVPAQRQQDGPTPSRWRLTATGWGWLAVTVTMSLVGWWKGLNLLLWLGYVMAGLFAVQVWQTWYRSSNVHLSIRQLPPIFAGENVLLEIDVYNAGPAMGSCLLTIKVGGRRLHWFIERLPSRSSLHLSRRVVFPFRGYFRWQAEWCIHGSFGWTQREFHLAPPEWVLLVLPALGRINTPQLLRWLHHHSAGQARQVLARRRLSVEPHEVRGVREYRPGDPLRAIHWRTTARHGQLMVREYDRAVWPQWLLVLTPPPVEASAAVVSGWEAALSLYVTLALELAQLRNGTLWLHVPGLSEAVSVHGLTELREQLAPLARVSTDSEEITHPHLGIARPPTARRLMSTDSEEITHPHGERATLRPPISPAGPLRITPPSHWTESVLQIVVGNDDTCAAGGGRMRAAPVSTVWLTPRLAQGWYQPPMPIDA